MIRSGSAGAPDPGVDWCGITVIAAYLDLPNTQIRPLQLAQSRLSVAVCNYRITALLVNRFTVPPLLLWEVLQLGSPSLLSVYVVSKC